MRWGKSKVSISSPNIHMLFRPYQWQNSAACNYWFKLGPGNHYSGASVECKICPVLFIHDLCWESNPRPFDLVPCPIHSATCSLQSDCPVALLSLAFTSSWAVVTWNKHDSTSTYTYFSAPSSSCACSSDSFLSSPAESWHWRHLSWTHAGSTDSFSAYFSFKYLIACYSRRHTNAIVVFYTFSMATNTLKMTIYVSLVKDLLNYLLHTH